jgi:uncharacterized spore protein YtfJ
MKGGREGSVIGEVMGHVKGIMPPSIDIEISVGEPMKIEDRHIYPVAKISIVKTAEGGVVGSWMTPLAMLVIESNEVYAISLTDNEVSVNQLAKMAPSLKKVINEAVDKAHGIYRIKVS